MPPQYGIHRCINSNCGNGESVRIAYIYQSNIQAKDANINQMFNMLSSMAKSTEVTLVSCWLPQKAYRETLEFFGIESSFKVLRLPVVLTTRWFFLEKITRLVYCCMALLLVLLRRYDVIYTRDFSFLLFISYLPRFLRPRQRIVYEAHKIYHVSSAQKVSYKLEQRALALADVFLPVSHGVADDLARLFFVDKSHIVVMEGGVNLKNFNRDGIEDRGACRSRIIYSGSFIDWKGVDVLIKAIKHMKASNFEVLVAGGVGADLEMIRNLAKAEGVADLLTIEGRMSQAELVPRLLHSGIGVLPNIRTSEGEKYTSPLKLFEYMACSLAIVAADLPAMREVLAEGENALFFAPSDSIQLAQQLDRLLADTELRSSMQQENAIRAQYYSWDNRADRILSLLR